MRYLEFTFKLTPQSSDFEDVFIDLLGEIGFDSFVKSTAPDEQMKGYIPVKDFRETDLKNCIADFPLPDVDINYTYQEAEDKDWNEVWEKNYFEPLVIGDQCVVAALFIRISHKRSSTSPLTRKCPLERDIMRRLRRCLKRSCRWI